MMFAMAASACGKVAKDAHARPAREEDVLAKRGLVVGMALHPADVIAAFGGETDIDAAFVVAFDHHDVVKGFALDRRHELA